MFINTLLIIKADYMHKRKPVLLKLLQKGFQIQGHRRLQFSPELAAEFFKDMAEDKNFMLQVILLSKGVSEAFILTKENAVEELIITMICYFTTSMEMERNVHVTKTHDNVHREISFIFPNYIHEPIEYFEERRFCIDPAILSIIDKIYDIYRADECKDNWKIKLAEWLRTSNKALPHISNQCSTTPTLGFTDKSQQVNFVTAEGPHKEVSDTSERSRDVTFSSYGSTLLMTSTSCISCSCFDGTDVCLRPPEEPTDADTCVDMVKAKTERLPSPLKYESETETPQAEDERLSCPRSSSRASSGEWLPALEEGEEEQLHEEGADEESVVSGLIIEASNAGREFSTTEEITDVSYDDITETEVQDRPTITLNGSRRLETVPEEDTEHERATEPEDVRPKESTIKFADNVERTPSEIVDTAPPEPVAAEATPPPPPPKQEPAPEVPAPEPPPVEVAAPAVVPEPPAAPAEPTEAKVEEETAKTDDALESERKVEFSAEESAAAAATPAEEAPTADPA